MYKIEDVGEVLHGFVEQSATKTRQGGDVLIDAHCRFLVVFPRSRSWCTIRTCTGWVQRQRGFEHDSF